MNLLKIFTYGGIIEVFIVPHILPCVSGFVPGYVTDMIQLGVSLVSSLFPHVTINIQSEVFFKVWKDLEEATAGTKRTLSSLPDMRSDSDSACSDGSLDSPGRSPFPRAQNGRPFASKDSTRGSAPFASNDCQPCDVGGTSAPQVRKAPSASSGAGFHAAAASDVAADSSSCYPCTLENSPNTRAASTTSGSFPTAGGSAEARKWERDVDERESPDACQRFAKFLPMTSSVYPRSQSEEWVASKFGNTSASLLLGSSDLGIAGSDDQWLTDSATREAVGASSSRFEKAGSRAYRPPSLLEVSVPGCARKTNEKAVARQETKRKSNREFLDMHFRRN